MLLSRHMMEAPSPILAPVIALVLWSVVMWVWMYATRIPAIQRAKLVMAPEDDGAAALRSLPARVRWKADNYNHLMEQPTIFYAVALTLALVGAGDGINALLAWSYVALRVIHSLIQALSNIILLRFAVFALGNVPLIWLSFAAAWQVFGGAH